MAHPSDTGLRIGDKVQVKVLGPNNFGEISLSRKALLRNPALSVVGGSTNEGAESEKTPNHDLQSDQPQSIDSIISNSTTVEGSSSEPFYGDSCSTTSNDMSNSTSTEQATHTHGTSNATTQVTDHGDTESKVI